MFQTIGKKVELLWHRAKEKHDKKGTKESCACEEKKEALTTHPNRATYVFNHPKKETSNRNERFMLVYNRHRALVEVAGVAKEEWVEDEENVFAHNVDSTSTKKLKYDQWTKSIFSVSNTSFGNFEMFFKVENSADVYIRAVKIYATAFPDQFICWGCFSNETEPQANSFLFRPGSTCVDSVEKEGVMTCHLSGDFSTVHIDAKAGSDTIPEYTSQLTVEVEYWMDKPVSSADEV